MVLHLTAVLQQLLAATLPANSYLRLSVAVCGTCASLPVVATAVQCWNILMRSCSESGNNSSDELSVSSDCTGIQVCSSWLGEGGRIGGVMGEGGARLDACGLPKTSITKDTTDLPCPLLLAA